MYTLSVDPASILCGVALWKDRKFVDSRLLKADEKILFSLRMQSICNQLTDFLNVYDAIVSEIVTEHNTDRFSLNACIGSLLVSPRVVAPFYSHNYVPQMSWKAWAQRRGAPGSCKYIKGVKALSATGFPHVPQSDDEADAIMIGLTYFERQEKRASETGKRRKT